MTGGLNGNKSLAALLIAVNVMLAGGLLAWAKEEVAALRADVMALRADVSRLDASLAVRVQNADREHDSYERRLDRLENRRGQ